MQRTLELLVELSNHRNDLQSQIDELDLQTEDYLHILEHNGGLSKFELQQLQEVREKRRGLIQEIKLYKEYEPTRSLRDAPTLDNILRSTLCYIDYISKKDHIYHFRSDRFKDEGREPLR